ncbi:Rab GTPase-TBC domain protein [Metarhizium robertsii]|uniref:Rab-GAP/TBC domain protein n=2 Tax=Metarhizium robertsii TaxID=568076 RepID=E9F6I8_METRA|nr:Rab-GAP/TBC domain protein [Metarhizium robertsii ARSEF 23]EFY96604.1 Rab-GAP/TBC domain protein [Metarhizium robertsii ARSEF 23]EXU98922.1 Rab GTPase-TBC domain protein [Metarhizium robertsii]
MIHEQVVSNIIPSPGSPPGMTTSKSSKSSSFQSLNSDDGSVLADVSHFEDIGLDDDNVTLKVNVRPGPTPLVTPVARNLAGGKRPPGPKPRRSFPNLHTSVYASNPRSTSLAGLTDPRSLSLNRAHSTVSLPAARRNRSTSPNLSLNPRDINLPSKPQPRPRRGSWQATRRKSLQELEHECDEDDGDDIPDGIVLDNVPISPRPVNERPPSRAPSVSPSPDRAPKERVRSIGNGTPAVAQAQGSLRSPSWKSDASDKPPSSPHKSRANSWNLALADLNAESKALTEKLEEHADELHERSSRRPSGSARPNTWNSSHMPYDHVYDKKARVKSSTPELPPLRRTDIMIDPLPISKEKEAVLSRTRPSWLPPKDPAEERRHLKEYQKMMAASAKADERREAARRSRTESRDNTADNLMHIWEGDIIPRWNDAIRERRTRDMWWRGVAPRSRGVVWARAIGNELGLTEATFRTALARARDLEERVRTDRADAEDARRAKWFEQIRKDASDKTWKNLKIFEITGPLHSSLVDVLSAYAMYRSDIGYVSGCNTIAALLLLNLPNAETVFIALANVLNRPLPLSFYTADETAQASAYNLVLQTLSHKSQPLHDHLTKTMRDVTPELYLGGMFLSLFTGHLAIDEAARLWDVYVFEGDALLVRAAVALLLSREMALLGSKTSDEVLAVITRANSSNGAARAVGEVGAEDRFMAAVREAGKA